MCLLHHDIYIYILYDMSIFNICSKFTYICMYVSLYIIYSQEFIKKAASKQPAFSRILKVVLGPPTSRPSALTLVRLLNGLYHDLNIKRTGIWLYIYVYINIVYKIQYTKYYTVYSISSV
jgi:hypothetical protein